MGGDRGSEILTCVLCFSTTAAAVVTIATVNTAVNLRGIATLRS